MPTVDQSKLIETFFATDVARFTSGLDSLAQRFGADTEPARGAEYSSLLELLSGVRTACRRLEEQLAGDDVTLRDVQQRYQDSIEPWFSQSWLMNHARTKPQGYAGDYAMLTCIYEGEPRSRGLGGLLDLFFLDTELGRAVPARKEALQDFLAAELSTREPGIKVLDVACGPCREFQDGVPCPADADVTVTFVDYDEDSLEFAEQTLLSQPSPFEFSFVRYNALRMQSPKRFVEEHGLFDVVYSVGLCDYLSDRQLIAMFKGWKAMLKPGGVLYVAFKDRHKYDKTDYQWLTDWFFLERDETDCRRLFADAGFKEGEVVMKRDATGIIMNFDARSEASLRIDRPHAVGGPKLTAETQAAQQNIGG